ncbi:MAG: aldo/keto reductase [Trueperaceae bacterium]|nr:aldo/keto reductase [Trueperaceae bacterium]
MKYRRLGSTEMPVSVVGIGTWQFGGEWGHDYQVAEVRAILDRARELGVNLLDTAECYGDHVSERLIGEAIEGRRDEWFVATKFGHRYTGDFQRDQLWSADEVLRQLDASLEALRTDHVDLYQFHSGSHDAFENADLWAALAEQVSAGRIRHLGISIGRNDDVDQTSRARDVGAEAIQVVYNRLDRTPEQDVFPVCQDHDLGVLARVPLASGFLSGRYRPGATFDDASDVRSRHDPTTVQRKLEEADRIRRDEVPEGVAMATWALAWCLQHPAVTCVIPGCKSVAQVEANAHAADLDLVRDDHPQAVTKG